MARHHSTASRFAFAALAISLLGCNDVDTRDVGQAEPVGAITEALLGPVTFNATTNLGLAKQPGGKCRGAGVANPLSAADVTAVQSFLSSAASRSRAVAASRAMAECLAFTYVVGGINYPWATDQNAGPFGPYCRPNMDPNCPAGTGDGSDPYFQTALKNASLSDAQFTQAVRTFNEGQSPVPMTLYCDNENPPAACGGTVNYDLVDPNGAAYVDDEMAIIGRATVETILRQQGLRAPGAPGTTCNSNDPPYSSFVTSQLMWHEALHFHGYEHEMSGRPDVWRRQVPGMYNFCMHRIQQVTDQVAGTPRFPAGSCNVNCGAGYHRLVKNFVHSLANPTGCTCVRDPGGSAARVQRTLFDGSANFAVTSWGAIFRLKNGKVFRWDDTVWTEIITQRVAAIRAGGDRLFVAYDDGLLFRADPIQQSYQGISNVADTAAGVFEVDDFGTAYKLDTASGVVSRCRLSETKFTALAANPAMKTIFAGGDQLYARAQNNDVYRYDAITSAWTKVGGPGSTFTVDEMGKLYGLAPDQSSISAYSLDTGTWSVVGGAAAGITAARTLFARNAAGSVLERTPDGQWRSVTNGWAGWAVGGPALVVRVNNSWKSFTDY